MVVNTIYLRIITLWIGFRKSIQRERILEKILMNDEDILMMKALGSSEIDYSFRRDQQICFLENILAAAWERRQRESGRRGWGEEGEEESFSGCDR